MIAEGESVAGASEIISRTKPAVTKMINNLEEEIGCKLFERSSNHLRLNRYGETFLRRAKAAIAEVSLGTNELKVMMEKSKEVITFNAAPGLIPRLIPKAIEQFRRLNPDVTIEFNSLIEGDPACSTNALLNGKYDMLITGIDINKDTDGIVYDKLLDINMIYFASDKHPALQLSNPTFRDLNQYSWIFSASGGYAYQLLAAAFKRSHSELPVDLIKVPNRQITMSLLKNGEYLAAMPYHECCFEADINDFNILSIDSPPVRWPVYFLKRENTVFSQAMIEFIEIVKKNVSTS
jgi:LysR family transcriptional regulator, regulator of abg operon